ncbi:MAG: hypothetical protein N3B16_06010 [Candidatus Aminicenantes bacterium]|nr:hypothetical protein [Candidatus Aminicenantes bacterium]
MIREEDNFIDSLLRHQVINDELDKEKPECFFNVRFLKFVPYLTFTLFFSFVLFFSVRYVNMSKDSITRSFEAATYLSLVYDATPTEACPYLLKWDQIVQAKSYVIHIFDSSLNSVWNNITYECQIRLPSDICEQIESGHQLLISFEAENSEGNIIFSWMGELPLTKINSGQKELKIRLR